MQINTCIICVTEYNIITTYIVVFQNKYIFIIILFVCCMPDMVYLVYSKIFINKKNES